MDKSMDELTSSALNLIADLIKVDEQAGRGYGGRALQCAADYTLSGAVCTCARCTLAFSLAMSIGADRMARMTADQLAAESDACAERWAAARPEGGMRDARSYRTIATNLRRLFPIS